MASLVEKTQSCSNDKKVVDDGQRQTIDGGQQLKAAVEDNDGQLWRTTKLEEQDQRALIPT